MLLAADRVIDDKPRSTYYWSIARKFRERSESSAEKLAFIKREINLFVDHVYNRHLFANCGLGARERGFGEVGLSMERGVSH